MSGDAAGTAAGLSSDETLAVILDILNQAAAAHGIHEATDLGGVRDEQWPEWYAQHMAANLARQGYTLVRAAVD